MGTLGSMTAGLYISSSQAGKLKSFRGLSSERLAADAKFKEAILSPQTTTLLLLNATQVSGSESLSDEQTRCFDGRAPF